MAEHLAALQQTASFVGGITALPDVPLVIISGGDLPQDTLAKHRQLARLSSKRQHLVASSSGHWIQFDEPALVVRAIRDVVDGARRTNAA